MTSPRTLPVLGLLFLTGTLLCACQASHRSTTSSASLPPAGYMTGAQAVAELLNDALFPAPSTAVNLEPDAFLELSAAQREELDSRVLVLADEADRYAELRRWVFRRFAEYEFDVTETYSVGELATYRKINCLSFSALYMAAARYSNVPAYYQLIYSPPYWDSDSKTWIYNQHINVAGDVTMNDEQIRAALDDSRRAVAAAGYGAVPVRILHEDSSLVRGDKFHYVVDISPAVIGLSLRRQVLNDQQVLSLYFSNKSMQSLLVQDLGAAYLYTREALLTDSGSSAAWNNLGVLYSRLGQLEFAAAAYEQAIYFNADAHSARSNLAVVYRRQGRNTEAQELEASVAEVVAQNPYYHQSLADQEISNGNYAAAITHLENAANLKPNEFLFYHELAIAHQQLGHAEAVIDNLTAARRYSRGAERTRFSGKLRALRTLAEAK